MLLINASMLVHTDVCHILGDLCLLCVFDAGFHPTEYKNILFQHNTINTYVLELPD